MCMFSELFIELEEYVLPILLFVCLFNIYNDQVQLCKVWMAAILDFESDILFTIYNCADPTHIKQLRPQFNLAVSHLLQFHTELTSDFNL